MHARRYLLAALVLPVFTVSARQQGAAASSSTIAATSLRATSSISELASMMAGLAAQELAPSGNLTVQHTRGFSS